MRRYKKYLFLGAVVFLIVSLPTLFVENIRMKLMGAFFPVWKKINQKVESKKEERIHQLEGENHLLRIEIGKLHALFEQKRQVESIQALPSQVIYRNPGSWTSSMWIDVGKEDNRVLGRCVVAKNSPVIVGKAVVGAIDFVGEGQSRVRLITDVALNPSVRAVRGYRQNRVLSEHLDAILRYLKTENENSDLIASLETMNKSLCDDKTEWCLAKGIVQGGGTPLWRSINHTLRGIGFNYDFPDEEGPARELISGKPVDSESKLPAMPLIEMSDLLVTTGMDGVFPPGLRVAQVTKVFPLREGAYTYEIEAIPVVGNLDTLQTVFVIPPLGYDSADQPN